MRVRGAPGARSCWRCWCSPPAGRRRRPAPFRGPLRPASRSTRRPAAGGGLVLLFSDADGWNDALDGVAGALAADGAAVVGVDLPQYLRGLAASDDGCHYLISEVEDLSKRLQRELGFAGYRSPILAGIGAGGTLAYAALAQSPAATVAGAVSVDPAPSLATRVPLCAGAPSEPVPGGGFRYGAAASLPGWWVVSPPDAVPAALRALATPAPRDGAPPTRLLALAARPARRRGSARPAPRSPICRSSSCRRRSPARRWP